MSAAIDMLASAAPSAPTRRHSTYLGGADVASILGIDPFRTSLATWGEKTGRIQTIATPAMEAGNDHEAGVIAGYTRRVIGVRLGMCSGSVERVSYPGPGTLSSTRDAWRAATPDALADHRRRGCIVSQAKFVGYGMAHEWGAEEDGPEGVPTHVLVQVHWETLHAREALGVRGEVAHVAAAIGTDLRVYEVEIDDEMISDLLDAGRDWWRRHVEKGEMPIATERDRAMLDALFPRERTSLEDAPESVLEIVREYDAARAAAKVAEEAKEAAAARLCAAIGEREGFNGRWGRATWKATTRTQVDWKAVAHALASPDLVLAATDPHTKTTTTRRLDVRLKGE